MPNKSIIENIKARYSCGSYDAKPLDAVLERRVHDYIESVNARTKI